MAKASDDCIVLSSGEEDDAAGLSPGEIGNSSASASAIIEPSFTQLLETDELNVPDEHGRILVNPFHARTEPDVFLDDHFAKVLKPHQICGVRFLFANLVGTVTNFNAGFSGSGCILAHSMGLGKTVQVISFLQAIYKTTKVGTCLIVVPANTLRLWLSEFDKWLPERLETSSGPEDLDSTAPSPRKFKVFIVDEETKTLEAKQQVISDWRNSEGVLIIGYEMLYRVWMGAKRLVLSKAEAKKSQTDVRKREFDALVKSIHNPGPDILICDEGHRLKSEQADLVKFLGKVRTKRRLLLAGYPMQNNLHEYYCMVDFIRPNHLGPFVQFKDLFMDPIMRGSCADSDPSAIALMRQRANILYSLLKGFMHRRQISLFNEHLPPKSEFVLFSRLTEFQAACYNAMIDKVLSISSGLGVHSVFRIFAMGMKIWNHPDTFVKFVTNKLEEVKKEDELDDDDVISLTESDDILASSSSTVGDNSCSARVKREARERAQSNDMSKWAEFLGIARRNAEQHGAIKEKDFGDGLWNMEWATGLIDKYKAKASLAESPKFSLLFSLIEHSISAGDRLIIFSQSLSTLDIIEEILQKTPIPIRNNTNSKTTRSAFRNWQADIDYYRLDGSTTGASRAVLISSFQKGNDDTSSSCEDNAMLFLISTRAGGLGINLTAANRVCIVDASWNPCNDIQALSRIYRFGQTKPCYVYRLIADNTLERLIFDRQLLKQSLARHVVDNKPVHAVLTQAQLKEIFRRYPTDDCVKSISADANVEFSTTDLVLRTVLDEQDKRNILTRPPDRQDSFKNEDPLLAVQLVASELRHARQNYEMAKNEYERVVLPTFSKRQRRGPSEFDGGMAGDLSMSANRRDHPYHPTSTAAAFATALPQRSNTDLAGKLPSKVLLSILSQPVSYPSGPRGPRYLRPSEFIAPPLGKGPGPAPIVTIGNASKNTESSESLPLTQQSDSLPELNNNSFPALPLAMQSDSLPVVNNGAFPALPLYKLTPLTLKPSVPPSTSSASQPVDDTKDRPTRKRTISPPADESITISDDDGD